MKQGARSQQVVAQDQHQYQPNIGSGMRLRRGSGALLPHSAHMQPCPHMPKAEEVTRPPNPWLRLGRGQPFRNDHHHPPARLAWSLPQLPPPPALPDPPAQHHRHPPHHPKPPGSCVNEASGPNASQARPKVQRGCYPRIRRLGMEASWHPHISL